MRLHRFLVPAIAIAAAHAGEPLVLKYPQAAKVWTEALPVGNGRLGAMVFGDMAAEHYQLNEASLWSGAPTNWNNPQAKEILPKGASLRMCRYVDPGRRFRCRNKPEF